MINHIIYCGDNVVQAPALPEKRKTRHGKELTLVLDLDETLVHCTVDPIANPDHRFEVHFNGEEFQVSAYTFRLFIPSIRSI